MPTKSSAPKPKSTKKRVAPSAEEHAAVEAELERSDDDEGEEDEEEPELDDSDDDDEGSEEEEEAEESDEEESDEEPEHDPTAADKRKQLLDLKQTLVSTWSAMRKGGVSDRQTFASPVGDWYMTCKLRSTPNNRNLDVVVTRPRGVGGRYRTLNALEDALDEVANSFA